MANLPINRPMIGEIFLKRKTITEEQLNQALEIQKKEREFIGEILVKLGYIEERDVVVALVIQCGLPYIAVAKYPIEESVLKLVPKNVAEKHHIIPLDKIGEILSVVMTSPLNDEERNQLEKLTQCKIATFISTRTEIDQAIRRWYK